MGQQLLSGLQGVGALVSVVIAGSPYDAAGLSSLHRLQTNLKSTPCNIGFSVFVHAGVAHFCL